MEHKRVISTEIVLLLIFGYIVSQNSVRFLDNLALFYIVLSVGIALSVWGAYIWVAKKNRKWYWCLLGLAAPIGILPLALLKYKAESEQEMKEREPREGEEKLTREREEKLTKIRERMEQE